MLQKLPVYSFKWRIGKFGFDEKSIKVGDSRGTWDNFKIQISYIFTP